MNRIENVEHILAERGIPSPLPVVKKYKRNDRYHGPLIIKAQIMVE